MGNEAEKAARIGEIQRQQAILVRFYKEGVVDLFKSIVKKTPRAIVTVANPLGNPGVLMTTAIIYSTKFTISEGEGRIFAFDNDDGTFSLGRGRDATYTKAYVNSDTCDEFFKGTYGDEQSLLDAKAIIEKEIGGASGLFNSGDKILNKRLLGGYKGVAPYRVIASSSKA